MRAELVEVRRWALRQAQGACRRAQGACSLTGYGLGRRVQQLKLLAAAEIHVHPARQARVKAAHRAHHVDALEMIQIVLLEDRLTLDGVLVRDQAFPSESRGLAFHGVGG